MLLHYAREAPRPYTGIGSVGRQANASHVADPLLAVCQTNQWFGSSLP